ncbi:sugar phosphate isomerase/epimerase family protein [Paenibacillus abyssi]|uniref:Xylose isomerase-like TIM barrel domain-containing protein n=1 Tax=Paenibacillus abyssi TaxID=1340531 RepID=A0A917CSI9_9BACL|nr:TIM barrel protein [Paenibacillus abyssi]GGF95048.1 hypothetical protein GCM10010916_10530 [Paenibacillus abyssi]
MMISLNSWSLEKMMGPLRMTEWNEGSREHVLQVEVYPEEITLDELLIKLEAERYSGLELSYAQLHKTSKEELSRLRNNSQAAGVELTSLLLDYGDLSTTDPLRTKADIAWLRKWIEIAAQAGFRRVRIGAGESPPDDLAALIRASEGLMKVYEYTAEAGIQLVTENLGQLLSNADNCLRLLELCQGKVGFTCDFGNFKQDKYNQLARVLPYADTVHAKAEVDSQGMINTEDFRRCLELCKEAGLEGPYSLTYLGSGDPWEKLSEMRSMMDGVLASTER